MTSILPASGTLRMTPARVLTLAIGVPVILALIGWTGFSFVSQAARASFPVSYAMGVQDGQLTVGVSSADITVRQGVGSSARLVVTTCERNRRDLVEQFALPAERIKVVYYGTDPEVFQPASPSAVGKRRFACAIRR